jgi:hypothetical protein
MNGAIGQRTVFCLKPTTETDSRIRRSGPRLGHSLPTRFLRTKPNALLVGCFRGSLVPNVDEPDSAYSPKKPADPKPKKGAEKSVFFSFSFNNQIECKKIYNALNADGVGVYRRANARSWESYAKSVSLPLNED